ncbi:MAG: GTPase ObgE [Phycisphaerales bacterium]
MFIDRARIQVTAGDGGNGKASFKRAKGMPKGGPDGGDGGKGGDIILSVDDGVNTLIDFRGIYEWKADHGEMGGSKQCTGADAKNRVIRVPAGTVVYNEHTGEEIADLGPGDSIIIAHGGKGGFGNEHFKNSVNQAPRTASPGEPGEMLQLILELKVIAEVGLVGLPNAGKSTLLKAVTRAEPKIANYPFTTLSPQLGIAMLDQSRRIVIADIPGLIEGAAEGAGLGHSFLRHIERTTVIIHVLDAFPDDTQGDPENTPTPAQHYTSIRQELMDYSSMLAEKPEIIALNKLDLIPEDEHAQHIADLRVALQLDANQEVFPISAATGQGTDELLDAIWKLLHSADYTPAGW